LIKVHNWYYSKGFSWWRIVFSLEFDILATLHRYLSTAKPPVTHNKGKMEEERGQEKGERGKEKGARGKKDGKGGQGRRKGKEEGEIRKQ
jgi:hypothetical protein